ncbi:hypothetical protein FNV43_RR13958 [Rhamnella rubrinervis]|uniref:Uncharacterized protein n=1 Tax=Rhamnella rubrinervis TaxID=2594499 RepID=A0A8K0H2D4_9ROSA|nr:hypothetical protein FNV43_RR13958 [Rhamnella rubrinervis]
MTDQESSSTNPRQHTGNISPTFIFYLSFFGHCVEQPQGTVQVTTFTVHIYDMVSNKEVSRFGTVVSNHETVKRQTFMEATVSSTGTEGSGVSLVAMRSVERIEEIKRFPKVAGRGKHAHPLEKIKMLGLQACSRVESLKTE